MWTFIHLTSTIIESHNGDDATKEVEIPADRNGHKEAEKKQNARVCVQRYGECAT
jgi:hypothetical protein